MAVNNLNTPGTGIQPTLVDAKGDLIAGVANDAVNRLAVGTNGQVLVADSGETTGLKWNNPGTVGGLVHIKTEILSAVAGVQFNDVFTTDFRNYKIVGNFTYSTTAAVGFRYRTSGSSNSTANYSIQRLQLSGTTYAGEFATGQTSGFLAPNTTTSVFEQIHYSPNLSSITRSFANHFGPNNQIRLMAGEFNATTVFDGIEFNTGANLTGAISIYGLKE